jgi:cytochrome b pre-mRNA-processing protein 3
MFGFRRKPSGRETVEALHAHIVAASRDPALFGRDGLPDTMEGRFEALVLHVLLVLRRLRALPAPAAEVAQDLVDSVFAHLEIALREMGIGDFGVPKRMKKLGQAFYDRVAKYDPLLDARDPEALAAEIGMRLEMDAAPARPLARVLLASEDMLARADLQGILSGPLFAAAAAAKPEPVR